MESKTSLATMIVNALLAFVALLVAFGMDIDGAEQTAIAAFVTAEVPIFTLAIGWLHHNRTNVAVAKKAAAAAIVASPINSTEPERRAAAAEVLA